MTSVSSQEFNRNPTSVKRSADAGPVYITERGVPAYVVVSIEDYRRLTGERQDLASYLMSDVADDYQLPGVDFTIEGTSL